MTQAGYTSLIALCFIIFRCTVQQENENTKQHSTNYSTASIKYSNLMQASMEQLLHDLGLLVPLVDLVKEGLQNSLNCLARLGLDVGNQLVVTLPLVLMENLLDLYQSGKDVSKTAHIRNTECWGSATCKRKCIQPQANNMGIVSVPLTRSVHHDHHMLDLIVSR